MTESEAKEWVKDKANQQAVVDRFFNDHQPAEMKLAIFMAGIPGAGKTEFAENTINEIKPKLVPIEHDKLVEYIPGYKPENYYNYRKAGSVLVTRLLDECLKRGYGFIFDGTLSHEDGYRNVEKTLKADYYVQIVYIVQDAKVAWQLTKDRELVKKRAIEKKGFIETCNKINKNLLSIFNRFKTHESFSIWVLNKNGQAGVGKASSIIYDAAASTEGTSIGRPEQIETVLSVPYNVDDLE